MNTVLGISIGTRYVGIALMRNRHLIDCQVKPFPDPWSNAKQAQIIAFLDKYLITHGVQILALKSVCAARSSSGLLDLEREFIILIADYEIDIHQYGIEEIKRLCNGQANKSGLAAYLSWIYPHLYLAYRKEKGRHKEYYTKMFEAVAVAHLTAFRKR